MLDKTVSYIGDIKIYAVVLCIVLIFRTVAAEPFSVPTSSMVPTIMVGDRLAATKFAYGYGRYSAPNGLLPDFEGRVFGQTPERGDVIVFRLPRDTSVNYVKRVIGLPGDTVQMREGRLYINGTVVPRRAAGTFVTEMWGRERTFNRYIETLPNGRKHDVLELSDSERMDNTPVFEVPEGHYFMVGDNRDNSVDSRLPALAGGVDFVPEENLIGRADVVLYSLNPDVAWWQVTRWPGALHRFWQSIS